MGYSMRKLIVGPILKDVEMVGLNGREAFISTAFYTKGPMGQLRINSEKLTLAVRLDFDSLADWVAGSIDPVALLEMAKSNLEKGSEVRLYVAKSAHAKMYIGEHSALIGSANLTSRGFSGIGDEVMLSVSFREQSRRSIDMGVKRYIGGMTLISIEDLAKFIEKNEQLVKKQIKRKLLSSEIRVEKILDSQRPLRLGSYRDFLKWLENRTSVAANEILERANGKNNLSGHIYRNYYGLRQYLIYSPLKQEIFRQQSEDIYKLSYDADTENDIARFVRNFATDEADFTLNTWKTYLPEECGGRAGKHGGTIGNLNRMLPLVAKYLSVRLAKN